MSTLRRNKTKRQRIISYRSKESKREKWKGNVKLFLSVV